MKLYEEPKFDEEGNFKKEPITEENLLIKLQLGLKEGVLKTNMGIPLVFVINKSDVVMQPGERKRFEEDSEFIVKHIRNLALTYGATTIYTSTKQNINLSVLYEYILHRIYKFDLQHKPNIMDKDSYFIPSGYDSLSTLKSFDIQEHIQLLYDERVPFVKPKNVIKEEEVLCEDIVSFLNRIKDKGIKRPDRPIGGITRENNQSMTEKEIRDNLRGDLNKQSSKEPDGKANPDFKQFYGSIKNQGEDINVGSNQSSNNTNNLSNGTSRTMTNEEKIEHIKRNNAQKLNENKPEEKEKSEKYEKSKENVLKKLQLMRKQKGPTDPKDPSDKADKDQQELQDP